MLRSTGLKIKTVEAVSLGMPLLSTAHASEGLPDREPSLLFADDMELAKELVEASFDRARLEAYRKASNQALIGLQTQASKSFEVITNRINKNPCVVIISNPELDRQSDYRRLWLNTLIYYLRNGREICMTTTTGIIPPLDLLKRAYGWQTECLKLVGEAGHESVADHFFAASLKDLCDTRTSVSCCIAAVPPKEQLTKILPSLKRLKAVLIFEELCDKDDLVELLSFLRSNGIISVIVTSRLGVNAELLSESTDLMKVLPYRYVDDLRDFFLNCGETNTEGVSGREVNMVKQRNGEWIHLSHFMHNFKSSQFMTYNRILVDEQTLIDMHGFILLLRIFGIDVSVNGISLDPVDQSKYLNKMMHEDPCHVFTCMNRNDAGWANVWEKTE
jgi:hypothetical protein